MIKFITLIFLHALCYLNYGMVGFNKVGILFIYIRICILLVFPYLSIYHKYGLNIVIFIGVNPNNKKKDKLQKFNDQKILNFNRHFNLSNITLLLHFQVILLNSIELDKLFIT